MKYFLIFILGFFVGLASTNKLVLEIKPKEEKTNVDREERKR